MFIIYSNNTSQLYSNLVYYDHNATYLCLVLGVLVVSKRSQGSGLPHCTLLHFLSLFASTINLTQCTT